MAYKVIISRNAEIEIEVAYDYYGKFSKQAMKSFRSQLHECYKRLKENPFFEVRYLTVRGLPFKKYPYIMLFRINENTKTVFVLSVFCTHQNPEKYP
ncbi:MAG: type II toxin-antitoxin system RelE/ParE family toxin [Flavobacteriaceae bacterium]|jgi:plasmid stabilization system protein ParE|nr:type II toxin-antitoxin system RelE/ParE family toxin [Flavobacteriaceae bacterium]